MKKYVVFLFVILFINNFSQTNVSPQFSELKEMEDEQGKRNILSNEILNLYPLQVGNKWIYNKTYVFNPNIEYSIDVTEILGDSLALNGKYYFHLQDDLSSVLERIDSSDGKVYQYYESPLLNNDEFVVADLLGEVGDTLESFCIQYPNNESFIFITGLDTFYKWGLTKLRKSFQQEILPVTSFYIRKCSYTQDIGQDYHLLSWPVSSSYILKELKGCIIDRIVYGDTTTVGVEDEENPIASEFKIEQNFPNPFNSSTTIAYNLEYGTFVSLIVYNCLGENVKTLVNEFQEAGTHRVVFESDNLPSGLYFLRIIASPWKDTKKMVLLK
jgi:hypothetical protein